MSKHKYLAPDLDNILLIIGLNSSSEAVFVPTSTGEQTFLPQILIHVIFGSFFPGLTSQTTEV